MEQNHVVKFRTRKKDEGTIEPGCRYYWPCGGLLLTSGRRRSRECHASLLSQCSHVHSLFYPSLSLSRLLTRFLPFFFSRSFSLLHSFPQASYRKTPRSTNLFVCFFFFRSLRHKFRNEPQKTTKLN